MRPLTDEVIAAIQVGLRSELLPRPRGCRLGLMRPLTDEVIAAIQVGLRSELLPAIRAAVDSA